MSIKKLESKLIDKPHGGNMSSTMIDPNKVISFPVGIPGFEEVKEYRVSHKHVDDKTAFWLESCDDSGLDFTLLDPLDCGLHYDLSLTDDEQNIIDAKDVNDLAVFLIVRKDDDLQNGLNANVGGPIILNMKKQIGMQKVIYNRKSVATIIG